MEKISNLLKEKRLEAGMTLEEVSEKTRLTIKHIKAIEEGDISYFKDDLSYLRFFLKAYCDVLGIDFEDIKPDLQESINDYTTSFNRHAVEEHKTIERNIQANSGKYKEKEKKTERPKKPKKQRQRKKIDFSLVSFLGIVLAIIIGLAAAFIIWIQKDNGSSDPLVEDKPPVADVSGEDPTYTKDAPISDPKVPEEEVKPFAISKVSETQYTLDNLKEGDEIDVEITFGSHSGFRALVDGVQLADPAQKVYSYKSVAHVREKAVAGKKITLAFGFMKANAVKVNGINVEFENAIMNKMGSAVIELEVKGE